MFLTVGLFARYSPMNQLEQTPVTSVEIHSRACCVAL